MANELSTIDVTQLPVADHVNSNDTLLIVRPNGDGTNTPMRVAGSALPTGTTGTTKKKKERRIVIGRAIRPRACEQGNVENWYCFGICEGVNGVDTTIVVRNDTDNHYKRVPISVYVKSYYKDDGIYEEQTDSNASDHDSGSTYISYYLSENVDGIKNCPIVGFRVDKYTRNADGYINAVYLSFKEIGYSVKSASTHHWFENSRRRYRPVGGDKMFVQQLISVKKGNTNNCLNLESNDLHVYKLMNNRNNRKHKINIHKTRYRKLTYTGEETAPSGEPTHFASHAKKLGGLYRAIPVKDHGSKTKGEPVYFYIGYNRRKRDGDEKWIEWK